MRTLWRIYFNGDFLKRYDVRNLNTQILSNFGEIQISKEETFLKMQILKFMISKIGFYFLDSFKIRMFSNVIQQYLSFKDKYFLF